MPELAVGAIVEICYKKNELKNGASSGYETLSIKRVEADDVKSIKNSDFPLRWSDKQDEDLGTTQQMLGTVIHVAEIETPKKGYVFYVYYDYGKTVRCLFDKDSNIDDEIYSLLEIGEVGYTVEVFYEETYVFYNRDICKGHIIRLPSE